MRTTIPRSTALLATGLLAGGFFYTYLNIIPTFYEVPEQVHFTFRTQLMTHNGIVMPALMALAIIGAVWYAILTWRNARVRNLALLAAGLFCQSVKYGPVTLLKRLISFFLPIIFIVQIGHALPNIVFPLFADYKIEKSRNFPSHSFFVFRSIHLLSTINELTNTILSKNAG